MQTALLPLELLLLASVLAAQSPAECMRDGLDKSLNNKLGDSPCTVKAKLFSQCSVHNDSTARDCLCNTITYNICAACALCDGDPSPTWPDWAAENACAPDPARFPSNASVEQDLIPDWAYQNLTSKHDFNLAAAIDDDPDPSGNPGLPLAAQVAIPIAVAVGVAIVVCLIFYWYWRRKWRRHRNPRMKTLPHLPNERGIFTTPRRLINRLSWALRSQQRPRSLRKDSRWEIDDDTHLLAQPRFNDPYATLPRSHSPDQDRHDFGNGTLHSRQPSNTSILPHIEFPDVRVPTFMERFIKFKDGIRKSATYQLKYVSPTSPDATFRIDGSDSPITNRLNPLLGLRSPPVTTPEVLAPVRPTPQSLGAPESDLEQTRSENITSDVLLISRDGENFSIDDAATSVATSPATARLPPSAYSVSTRSPGGASSFMPSPRRANTSSTVSGAYPRELRRDPNLASPPSWANRFPPPPSASPRAPAMTTGQLVVPVEQTRSGSSAARTSHDR